MRARSGKRLVPLVAVVVAMGGLAGPALLSTGPVAEAATVGPVDPTIPDGNANSLRDVLENQVANGDTVVLQAGATYTLDDCGEGDIDIAAAVTIEGNGATIRQTCPDRVLDTASDLTVRDATLTGGRVDGEGGAIDAGGSSLVLERARLVDNQAASDGGAIDSDGDVTITDSELAGNKSGGDGGAFDDSEGGITLRIVRSTIAGNCSEDEGGAISTQSSAVIVVVNSTVTQNTAAGSGAIDADNTGIDVTLVYSDVVANTLEPGVDCGLEVSGDAQGAAGDDSQSGEVSERAVAVGEGANVTLGADGTLSAFGSVVAKPTGAPNCGGDETSATTSAGFNFSDDASCGFTAATDKQNAGDPMLGALADNGGPTRTLLPQAGSPLVNAIPVASCGDGDSLAGGAVTTDQRGVARPQETGCEIGSVEIPAVIPVQPITFTG